MMLRSILTSVTSAPRPTPPNPSWLSTSLFMRRHSLSASSRIKGVTGNLNGRRGRRIMSPNVSTILRLLKKHLMAVQLITATSGIGIKGPSRGTTGTTPFMLPSKQQLVRIRADNVPYGVVAAIHGVDNVFVPCAQCG